MSEKRFEPLDDRTNSFEAPPTEGFYMDAGGQRLDTRPDQIIERYLGKVTMTNDQFWQVRKYIDSRQWFELDLYLDRIQASRLEDADDQARIKQAKETIAKILGAKT